MKTWVKLVLAIALILALLLITSPIITNMLLQATEVGGGIGEPKVKSAWATDQPLAITDYSQSGNELTVVIKNNSSTVMTLREVCFDESCDTQVVPEFEPDSTVSKTFTMNESCTVGETFYISPSNIKFSYDTEDISGWELGVGAPLLELVHSFSKSLNI